MDVRIRRGREGDIETLAALIGRLFEVEKDFQGDADNYRAGLRMLIDGAASAVFVAEAGGSVAGMVTAQLVVSTAAGGHSVLLEDMYVAAGMRRRRIGTKLLEEVLAWGWERGARRIQLVAAASNTGALMFYRQSGLLTSGMTALYGKLADLGPDWA
jgi:GNAT superfamily N-acetyltransferase